MVTASCPAKVTRRSVPLKTSGPPADRPRSTWLKVTGRVPNWLDSLIRAAWPPALVHTTFLTV